MDADDKNIAELARDTAIGISNLAANEVRLAAAELQDSIDGSAGRFRQIFYGATLFIPGVSVGLVGLASGIHELGVSIWIALTIVGAFAIGGGYAVMKSGKDAFSPEIFFPKKTLENLRKDARTIKDAAA